MVAACPFPANYGSPGAIREMAESLATLGHDVNIVTYPFGENLPVKRAKISRCWGWSKKARIYSGPSVEKLFLDLFLLIKLCRVITSQNIEVIHAHNYEGALIGFVAKVLTGRPLLYNAVNLMSDELPTYEFLRPRFIAEGIARFLDFVVTRVPDGFIAITEDLRSALLKRGVSPDRIALVPCGVILDMFERADPEPLRKRYAIGHRPLVMYTGINSPIQRLDYLLRAFALVLRKFPDALLMVLSPLYGDTHLPKNRQLAAELGIDASVVWVEGHELKDLPSYLAMASITVISRPDMPGHPIKLLNYMAAATPIVCSAGAAKGLRHLHDAFLTRDHDWNDLAEGIVMLLKDRLLAERLANNARQTVVRNFDWLTLCGRVGEMYGILTKSQPLEPAVQIKPAIRRSSFFKQPSRLGIVGRLNRREPNCQGQIPDSQAQPPNLHQ
jgi:1,2-diacylglycerol 3-alpha-glucosyltransferase